MPTASARGVAFVGADLRDTVTVEGIPRVDMTFHGGVTTPADVVDAVSRVRAARSGLATMFDIATQRFDHG